jgi:hypothetical protein
MEVSMASFNTFLKDVSIGVISATLGAPAALCAYMLFVLADLKHIPNSEDLDPTPFGIALCFGSIAGLVAAPIARSFTGAIQNRYWWCFSFFLLTLISFPITVFLQIAYHAF